MENTNTNNINVNKSIVMSISVKPETQELLKDAARKSGRSVSDIMRVLVQKHLSLVVNNGEETSVVLRVPKTLKGDELRSWLTIRIETIVKLLEKNVATA